MGISKRNPDKRFLKKKPDISLSRKGPDKRFFKRVARHGTVVGAILGIALFSLDFFNVDIDLLSRENRPPEIRDRIQLSRSIVPVGETVTAIVFVNDPDGDEEEIHYFWGSSLGKIQLDRFQGPKCTYIAPDQTGVDVITVTVYDDEGATNRDFTLITIKEVAKVKSP